MARLIRFKEFHQQRLARKTTRRAVELFFEHEQYKRIPGTSASYRQDRPDTTTLTQKHVHVYAKPSGRGKELYSVNLDGTGHDGSSGAPIPATHADYFRSIGYTIASTNILEALDLTAADQIEHELVYLVDELRLMKDANNGPQLLVEGDET